MDTSLSLRHRLDIKIPRVKFFEVSLILKGESDATTEININKNNFYVLQNNTNKDYNANIYK